jgi:hypothetical protein
MRIKVMNGEQISIEMINNVDIQATIIFICTFNKNIWVIQPH